MAAEECCQYKQQRDDRTLEQDEQKYKRYTGAVAEG